MEKQVVVFDLNNNEYAIEIIDVNEIIIANDQKIFPVPNMPEYVIGVINYRGKVLSIIDLKIAFGLDSDNYKESSKIIIINNNNKLIGFIVDEVEEILKISEEDIHPNPQTMGENDYKVMEEIIMIDERIIAILNLNNFFKNKVIK